MGYVGTHVPDQDPTFNDFLASLKSAGVEQNVEAHRAFSRDVAAEWTLPIRLF